MNTGDDTALKAYAHLMLEHLPMGIALFDAHKLRLLAANACYHSFCPPEWQQERAIGHSLVDLLPHAERTRITAIFHKVAQTGAAEQAETYMVASPTRGQTYWNWTLYPISEQGQVRYLLLTATDVTSQVAAHKLAEQEHTILTQAHQAVDIERQRLHTILDQLPEGVLLVDARTSKVSYANPAAAHLLGFALPQLIGMPLNQSASLSAYNLSRRGQQSAFQWNFSLIHALWGKTSTSQELLITRPDGSEVIVLSSTAPIRLSNGLISEAVLVFQDITAMKQLERQKNEFFAVANHELRTPLTIILGFTELLRQHATDQPEGMYEYAMASITQECEHLLRLIEELLDVSRLEQTELKLWKSYQDLLTPLKRIIHESISTIQTHRIYFTLKGLEPTDLLMGWFDLQRIEQILLNLITNAIKYSPTGSEIEVGISPRRDASNTIQEVSIWVKDQGIGIGPKDLPHIFERFYRADTHDSSISGFGIGLYLTKELVQGHGGRIRVESTEGQGSTFIVVLPLRDIQQVNP